MIRKIAAAAGAFVFLFHANLAYSLDGASIEIGRGDDRTSLLRVAVVDYWRDRPEGMRDWRLAGYWELAAGAWDNHDESTAEIALTPVFRIEHRSIYVEGAIGIHLVQARISAARVFSTAFQFGDHIGAGIRSGKYELGLRVQHISNGGVRHPNPGINFFLMRLQYEL